MDFLQSSHVRDGKHAQACTKRGEGKEKDQHFLLQMEACMTRERERDQSLHSEDCFHFRH
jgi:hypothetical protein